MHLSVKKALNRPKPAISNYARKRAVRFGACAASHMQPGSEKDSLKRLHAQVCGDLFELMGPVCADGSMVIKLPGIAIDATGSRLACVDRRVAECFRQEVPA